MERQIAATDSHLPSLVLDDLGDIHLQVDVELPALRDEFADTTGGVLPIIDAVDRRPEAGAEELVHVLADDRVVGSALLKTNIPATSELPSRAAPAIALYQFPLTRLKGRIAVNRSVPTVSCDPGSPGEREPDERADAMPEVVLRAQPTDEIIEAVVGDRLGAGRAVRRLAAV